MSKFCLLFEKTLRSSLWRCETPETRIVFLTMLMLKDADGKVETSRVGLRDMANVTQDQFDAALGILLSDDDEDSSKVDGGKRVKEIPGGFQIVNNDLYRFSTEAKRAFWAAQKAEQRAAKDKVEKERGQFEAGYESEKAKRKKRTPREKGQEAGGTAALNEGLAESERAAAPGPDFNGGSGEARGETPGERELREYLEKKGIGRSATGIEPVRRLAGDPAAER